ncbi:hypothetical protein C8Q80DRAFT_1273482 [Daedaleopsis nitida]|nr:hypothetical protein C8Q80DRAFT_1273482 [Daedaleopsis nitida]
MSPTTTYHLRPVSAMTRSSSPTASTSTASDRSPPPLGAHHPPSKTMLPPSTTNFSPIPTNARPRRPLSPSSLRDVDIPLDPERAFAARGNGFFEREERKFFAQAGKEIVRLRLEIDTRSPAPGGGMPMSAPALGGATTSGPGMPSPVHSHHHRPHPHPHRDHGPPPPPGHSAPPPPAASAHSTSPRMHLPPNNAFPLGSPQGPAHPGYPVSRPQEHEAHPPRGPGGGSGSEAMVVEDDEDDAWRRPTPHNARRRAGKHTRRVIVK